MGRQLLMLILAGFLIYALPQFGDVGNFLYDVSWRAEEGTIAVRITPDLAGNRKEVYLGERLWLAFQVKTAYRPCPLSIIIRDLETGEVVVERYTTLNVCGGQILSGMYWIAIIPDFRIVEPVREGRRYKVEVRAGAEYGAFTFTERHNPIGEITGMTILSGGRIVGKLRAGERHEVRVRVRNTGEVDYRFGVRLYVNGELVNRSSVVVRAGGEGEAALGFVPRGVGAVNITVVVGGVVDTDVQSVVMDVVYPTPKFVLLEPTLITVTVGEEYRGVLRLRNYGESCPNAVLETPGGLLVDYKSVSVPSGGELTASLTYRPIEAERGNFTIVVRCGDYRDVVYVPYMALGVIKISARDEGGRSITAAVRINGEVREEAKLGPGVYTVEAQMYIEVSPGVRYVFAKWGDGVVQNSRTVKLGPSVQLEAVYKMQYRVVLWGFGAKIFDGWVDAGGVLRPEVQMVRYINATVREVFKGWSGAGCPARAEITVTAPIECKAVYVREFYVEVRDPTGRYSASGWFSNFTVTISRVVEEDLVRHVFMGANCPSEVQGEFATLYVGGPAVCDLKWRREFRVFVSPGLEGYLPWSGWLPEGAEINYVVGASSVLASSRGLQVPDLVERGEARYRPRGWTCGEAQVVVKGPVNCTGLWDVERRVKIAVVVNGVVKKIDEIWARDKVELKAEVFKPTAGLFETLSFAGWEVGGQVVKEPVLYVIPPAEVKIIWTSFSWLPIAAVIFTVATGLFIAIKRRRRVVLEPVGEETQTYARS